MFDYDKAFSRNLGWLSKSDQKNIAEKTIAIPGMGGVGSHHLHSLARIGFQNFKIADFDSFDVHNFNRQIGANMETVGRNKAQVMKEFILKINPNAQIEIYDKGVTRENSKSFLQHVDYIVDGLDIYVLELRKYLYEEALRNGIYVITAAPLGAGTSYLCFSPEKMSFNEYFGFKESMDEKELFVRFLTGVAPYPMQTKYIEAEDEIDISIGKLPSLHTGVLAATTAISAEVMKLALGRGKVRFAPFGSHMDFYLNKYKKFWRPFGHRNPLSMIVRYCVHKKLKKLSSK